MTAANYLLRAAGSSAEKLYVDDVFTSWVRTGTGADVTTTTGIDMTNGYMLWSKGRSGATDHAIYDSARGVTFDLVSNSTAAQTTQSTGLKSVSSTGHTVGSLAKMNTSGSTYVDWVFRRAPKFLDVVTYTGNGVAGRQIPHALGIAPGMIIVKRTSAAYSWCVWHGGFNSGNGYGFLNTTAAFNSNGGAMWGDGTTYAAPTSSTFSVSTDPGLNTNGDSYVAYLFAHDTSTDGLIQCGSFTTDASGNATVNLGWEPQFLIAKHSNGTQSWLMQDDMRGFGTSGSANKYLLADLSNAEASSTGVYWVNSTGFGITGTTASATYIYLAIRRPNKPPTTGTQVYNAIARTGTGAAATVSVGFNPDLAFTIDRNSTTPEPFRFTWDRLRGLFWMNTASTVAEAGGSDDFAGWDAANGVRFGQSLSQRTNGSGANYINHFFRRAPGFMDEVCYTGSGANKTEAHNLTKAPELWMAKRRNDIGSWTIGSSLLNANEKIVMPSPNGRVTDATAWNSTYPTATALSLGTLADVNASGGTYVAYLWASTAGISKVFTYTGNGTSQTIDCGFTTGARFVMIIRVTASTAQDIYVWDSARGITSGNDPQLSLNTTAAEVTTLDTIDPASSGFIVNQDASNVNVNGAVYIGLAYA